MAILAVFEISQLKATCFLECQELLRMNAFPSNATFWKERIVMEIPVVLKCFSRLPPIVPRVPIAVI